MARKIAWDRLGCRCGMGEKSSTPMSKHNALANKTQERTPRAARAARARATRETAETRPRRATPRRPTSVAAAGRGGTAR
eukprot:2490376-Prymnesium_polylepis.1